MFIDDLLIYIISFISIWLGAGLIIKSIDLFSRHLKLSSFLVSFFVLGLLTSIPELGVGISSINQNDPEIFVGNLIGGIPVIFLFIIPILAVLGGGVKLSHQINNRTLLFSLLVIAAPSFFVLDQRVTNLEGVILIALYLVMFFLVEKKKGVLDESNSNLMDIKSYSLKNMVNLMLGIVIVFASSQIIVSKTILFSEFFQIPPFLLSLIILSLGTNLPELSLAIRSVLHGRKDVALGDYLGSAAANTLLFGMFTLINDGEVLTANNFVITFLFIFSALGLFYVFSRSQRRISRFEGVFLILVYVLFVAFEFIKR